ncbi:MAG TPA: protein kinase [Kofleriaceae bacterium]
MEGWSGNAQALIGRTLGEFVVREPLSRGGFGLVFRAEQPGLGREAVIKVLHIDLLQRATIVQRFLREARMASRLDHPYAAHTYAFGAESDGVLWIAMEMVRGTPLDALLSAQGPLPLERFVPLIERICEVVHTAHEQGIVHRDLKPANVMVLARAGRLLPKLLDFGIAKIEGEPLADEGAAPAQAAVRLGTPAGEVSVDGKTMDASTLELTPPAVDRAARRIPVEVHAGLDGQARLTHAGTSMGSPPYMAPEQWNNASAADARTDLYALGALSYEALSGRPPFDATTGLGLALAHKNDPVPPLPDGLPRELDAVITRAMAKQPADRYATALELAAAFRAASGVASEASPVPRLDEALRAELLATAPQPLAQAVAMVDAARNPHQARDAVWKLTRVAVRLLGIAALASHSHVGTGPAATDEALREALRGLRRRGLSDTEWLALTRDLVRRFIGLRDAHPIPELVDFLAGDGGARLDELVALRAAHDDTGGGSEEQVRALLAQALPLTNRVLAALRFLTGYPLAVPDAGGLTADEWMGVGRQERRRLELSRAVEPGRPMLVDPAGVPVVSLWPFVQVHEPAPGAPPALFLFEGKGRRGARMTGLPNSFEREDEELWRAIGLLVGDSIDTTGDKSIEEACPYPGLAAFTAADAASFFGRERESEAFLNRLRVTPLLAAVGPSGAGKSSLVQAGVLAALPAEWRAVVLRPGPAPIDTMATRLAAIGVDTASLREDLERHPGALASSLRAWATARHVTLVVVIDQLEEIFTACDSEAERALYSEALARAARSPDDPVRVVLTLRDDFLLRAEALPAFRSRLAQGLELVTTPAPPELRRILVEPLRRAGYEFDDPALPQEMVEEVADRPAALALLSFTASRLWELRDRRFRQVGHKAYRSLGGVGGALAQHAEATLKAMSAAEQRLTREVFRAAVTAEGTRAVLAVDELRHAVGGGASADGVIEKLVAARLLVISDGEAGGERIEITHEALLDAWPRLVAWRREDAEGARLRDQLRAAARQWQERKRPSGLLWRGDALAEYRRWNARHGGRLGTAEEAFIAASLREERRARRRGRALLGAAFALMAVVAVVLFALNRRAQRATVEARRQLVASTIEEGRVKLLSGRRWEALARLVDARRMGASGPALDLMRGLARAPALAIVRRVRAHQGRIWSARYSPDGTLIATTGEDGAALWEAETGRLVSRLAGHRGSVRDSAWDPTGRRLATVGFDGAVKIWDSASGRELRALAGPPSRFVCVAWHPGGTWLASSHGPSAIRVWDPNGGQVKATVELGAAVAACATGARGLAVGLATGQVFLIDPDSGTKVELGRHDDWVRSIRFDAAGERLVTASRDRTVRVWSAAERRLIQDLRGAGERLEYAEFSPDGSQVVAAARDGTARLWDVASGRLVATLTGHRGTVWDAEFDASGTRILTAADDGSARLWDRASGISLAVFEGHANLVGQAHFSPDGARAVSASDDGTFVVWRTEPAHLVSYWGSDPFRYCGDVQLGGPLAAVACPDATEITDVVARRRVVSLGGADRVALSPDGTRAATARESETRAVIWQLPSGREAGAITTGAPVSALAVSADGRVAVGDETGALRLWDVGSARETVAASATGDPVVAIAFAGSRWVATTRGGAILVLEGARALHRLSGPPGLGILDESPDGATLAMAGAERGDVLLLRLDGRPRLDSIGRHQAPVVSASFDQTGARLVTTSEDGTGAVWDVAGGRLLRRLVGSAQYLADAAFDRSGGVIVAVDGQGSLQFFDAESARLLGVLEGPGRPGRAVRLLPDGTLAVVGNTGEIGVWRIPVDRGDSDAIERELACLAPGDPDRADCRP